MLERQGFILTLEEFILTARGTTDTGEQGVICNIPDYYERYIKPLDKRFAEYNLYSSRTVICPLHSDTDPSLGLINHRFLSDVKIYHCFGCGASGTVIRLHQYIQDLYYNRKLTEKEACMELADLFNVNIEDYDEIAEDDYNTKYVRMLKRISKAKKAYTINDFSRNLLNIRKNSNMNVDDKLSSMNMESVKMIATKKKLYS